jgi:molybdate transport system substrate-binding protein
VTSKPKLCSWIWFVIITNALLWGCQAAAPSPDGSGDIRVEASPAPRQSGLIVAAASDLQFAFPDLARLFEQETGQEVTLVFGSTGLLTQQIENGAPYDLFAAADSRYIERLARQNLLQPDSIRLYARGRLVLAANIESGVTVDSLSDLLSPNITHISIANPAHAPYGRAAQEALVAAGFWEDLEPKLVFGENVRQALQYIQTGDAQAGLIAESVADVPEISWRPVAEDLYQPLHQALGVLTTSQKGNLAGQFADLVTSEQGRSILAGYGFALPDEAADRAEQEGGTSW